MLRQMIDRAARDRHPAKSREEIKAEVVKRHDRIGLEVAKRFTRGNVNIKRGAILTREDLDARHKR